MHIATEEHEKKSIKLANRGVIVFEPTATKEELDRRHYHKWKFKKSHFTKTYTFENYLQIESADALPLMLLRSGGEILFHSEQSPLKPEEDDVLLSYVPPSPEKQ